MATSAYTQEQINQALAAELAARPGTSQAALNAYAKATYGLTDAQLNAAYDTIPGFNAQGQYDAADYIATSRPGQVSPQMVVDAANAANPYSAQNMAIVDTTRPGQYVTDTTTGRPVALSAYSPGFDINNPTALQSLGELRARGGTDSTSQAFNAIATPAQKAEADRLWSIEKARLDAIDRQAGLLTTTGQTTQAGQATKAYTPAQTALYNAFRSGDIGAVNNAIQSGKLTADQIKSDFGLTDADMSYLANSSGVKFYTPPTAVTTNVGTGPGGVPGGLGGLGGIAQNFANYQSIPIGAQYNQNVVSGVGSPYSQVMSQMRPFQNPYAGMAVNQPLGGYNPGLYDQIAAANLARDIAAKGNTTLADYYGGGGDGNDASGIGSQGGDAAGNTGGGPGTGAEGDAAYAMGGMVNGLFGMNPPGPDDGAGYLDRGEYVVKKSAVNKYGKGLLDMINEGKVPAKKMKSLLG